MNETVRGEAQGRHLSNLPRNLGMPLKVEWFEDVQVNLSATERRAASLLTRRTVKKNYQAAWLIKALQCIDLTTLAGDDTPGRVQRLCHKAMRPVREDIVEGLGLSEMPKVGAVCVYPTVVADAVKDAQRFRHSGRRRCHGLSSRPDAAAPTPCRNPLRCG